MSGVGPGAELAQRLAALRTTAEAHPEGVVDCNIGTPCDPVPAFVTAAVTDAVAASGPYPLSAGSVALRDAARAWIDRRFGVACAPNEVAACVGTKEFVASLPHLLRAGGIVGGERDTVLFPEIAYPTYAVGAQLAGMRAVPVPLGPDWLLDLDAIDPGDAARAAVLWMNVPGNPTAATADAAHFQAVAEWGRAHGVLVVSDECYVEFAPDAHTIAEAGTTGVLALHSLSKRSNFAGMRCGFYAGDADVVAALVAIRREAGLIVATPAQAATIAALGDDAHVREQHARYERRRATVLARLAPHGIEHCGGSMPMYLWLRATDGDGFDLAQRCASAGWLIAPGATFGEAGTPYARIALVQPDEVLHAVLDRFDRDDPGPRPHEVPL